MIAKIFSRAALHEHAEPAQRILGAADLSPDSEDLARLLASDPVSDVRAAAARRCTDLGVLAAAWESETDASVRDAIADALAQVLAATHDEAAARALLEANDCNDAIRSAVARRTHDGERRHAAIACIRDEETLVELALVAGNAETRLAAAERVHSAEGLRKLADAAKNKDHGVARLARQRIDAVASRNDQATEADSILAQLEALATRPGLILTAVVELNRRWQTLDVRNDPERLARCESARQAIQARFDREHEEQRTRARLERKVREWVDALDPAAPQEALVQRREELAALRDESQSLQDAESLARLDQAALAITQWEQQHQALAEAEALVNEAEQLAAGTSIDDAKLPERWQALDRALRTAPLTRRFEAALIVVEQRRLAQVQAAQQESNALRQRLHGCLHAAEQALAAGQLQAARAAFDEMKSLKAAAGHLPKPTLQRLSRVQQQLADLERWESFGQQTARVQLCERAEALANQPGDLTQLAHEVQKLRNEWKALDQQHSGVPKALWERFDKACERAYAPAAKHFAELAARRKEARRQREAFIAAADAHVPTLLADTPDWRTIERWLRDTDQAWREGDLGSVEPGMWKKLDVKLRTALAPLRDALTASREAGKTSRRALIEEVRALAGKATERDTPSQVKAIQGRWQEQAKSHPLPQRDERALWDEFRAACDAVFEARHAKRKEDDGRKQEGRRALEDMVKTVEELAQPSDKDDQEVRRALRDLQEQWRKKTAASELPPGLDTRFKTARSAVETLLSSRSRARESAVWRTLSAKERLCEELDQMAASIVTGTSPPANNIDERWDALPALPAAWETKLRSRRDAALRAVTDTGEAAGYHAKVEHAGSHRSEMLLELETLLGLESPPELQAHRLALQVKQLRDRFQGAATQNAANAGERLVAWCAQPGRVDARDRKRSERIFAAIERAR